MGHDSDTVPALDLLAVREAILAAGSDPSDEATATLLQALTDPEDVSRTTALGALARSGRLEARHVIAALQDSSSVVRRRAAQLSPKAKGKGARGALGDALAGALADADPLVVINALTSLGERRDRAQIDAILILADTTRDSLILEEVTACVAELGDPRGLSVVLRASEGKPALRRRSVAALGGFEGPEVERALDRLEGDRDWQVRQAVAMLRRGEVI
jgi:HEAT repeat protein